MPGCRPADQRVRVPLLRARRLAQHVLAGLGPHGRQERRVASGQAAHALLVASVLVELLTGLEMIAVEDQGIKHLVPRRPRIYLALEW